MKRLLAATTLTLLTTTAFAQQITHWSTETHTPHFADINGDGSKDLLLQAKSPDENSLLVLGETTQSVVPIELANAKLALGDVNGDTFADLFVVYPQQQMAMTYLGSVDGFQSSAAHQYRVDSLSWLDEAADVSLLAGDFNGATRYELQEQTNNGSWFTAHNGLVNSMAFTQPIVANYNYRVKACNATNQCSGWSVVLPAMSLKNTFTANDVLGTPILRSDNNTTVEKTKYSYPFGQQEDKQ